MILDFAESSSINIACQQCMVYSPTNTEILSLIMILIFKSKTIH